MPPAPVWNAGRNTVMRKKTSATVPSDAPAMSLPQPALRRQDCQAGFSLLEMAVVLGLIGLVSAGAMQIFGAYAERQTHKVTRERLEAIADSLVLHAARTGVLPCPASVLAGGAAAGVAQPAGPTESCNTGQDMTGVPWRTLGIPQQTSYDGWRRRITYVVFDGSTGVTRDGGLAIPVPGCPNGPGQPCIGPAEVSAFLQDKGLTLLTAAGDPNTAFMDPAAGTGAAFVLISHGPNGAGAWGAQAIVAGAPPAGTNEQENSSVNDLTFVQARTNTSEGAAYYDDLVTAMRLDALAYRAGGHLAM